jgi:hypothetical protein
MVGSVDAYLLLAGYLLLHAATYFLLLGKLAVFQRERVIFLFHFVSAVATTLLTLVAVKPLSSEVALDTAIGLIAMHGIYSVSFLELWAISDDSYSLAILTRIAAAGVITDAAHLGDLRSIGARKQKNRLEGLKTIGLVDSRDDLMILTTRGRWVAHAARALLRLVNIRRKG